jgi:hypothetical protein
VQMPYYRLRLHALYPDSAGRWRPELGLGRMMWASATHTKCFWSKEVPGNSSVMIYANLPLRWASLDPARYG